MHTDNLGVQDVVFNSPVTITLMFDKTADYGKRELRVHKYLVASKVKRRHNLLVFAKRAFSSRGRISAWKVPCSDQLRLPMGF